MSTLLISNSDKDDNSPSDTAQTGQNSAAKGDYKQFRPYADLAAARFKASDQRALSPKLIPYKHNSFSSSDRSSASAKNQEASQGQGHMFNARNRNTTNLNT